MIQMKILRDNLGPQVKLKSKETTGQVQTYQMVKFNFNFSSIVFIYKIIKKIDQKI